MSGRRATAMLLAAVPLLTGGCGLTGASSGAGAEAAADRPSDSWVVVARGTATPSASALAGVSPTASPLPTLPAVPTPATPTASSPATCDANPRTSPLAGLTVQPGAGTAVVTWYHGGDPAMVEYRLTALPQRIVQGSQPDLAWQSIAAGTGCRTVTATVTGLDRAAPYVFSLDAVRTNHNSDGTRTSTVARSSVVHTS
jgi:hypothetical protein